MCSGMETYGLGLNRTGRRLMDGRPALVRAPFHRGRIPSRHILHERLAAHPPGHSHLVDSAAGSVVSAHDLDTGHYHIPGHTRLHSLRHAGYSSRPGHIRRRNYRIVVASRHIVGHVVVGVVAGRRSPLLGEPDHYMVAGSCVPHRTP